MNKISDILKCPETHSHLTAIDYSGEKVKNYDSFNNIIFLINSDQTRWYPVINEIPSIFNDNIRDKTWDQNFYNEFQNIFSSLGINISSFNDENHADGLNDRFDRQRFMWGEQPKWENLYASSIRYDRSMNDNGKSKVQYKSSFFSKNLDCYYGNQPRFQKFVDNVNSQNNKIILDVGCGDHEKENFFDTSNGNIYIGIDILGDNNPNIQSSADALPIGDSQIDFIICDSVLEHVYDPNKVVNEIFRVLKPGGSGYFVVPFSYKNHGAPFDFYRYTKSGLHTLLRNYSNIYIYPFGGTVHAFGHMVESVYPHLPLGIGKVFKGIHNIIFFFLNKIDKYDKYKLFSRGFYAFVTK